MYFRPIRLIKLLLITISLFIFIYQLLNLINFEEKNSFLIDNEKNFHSKFFSRENDFYEKEFHLDPFYIELPNFSDDDARHWFYNSSYYKFYSKLCFNRICENKGFLFNQTKEHLLIRTAFVKNGLYLNDDCGYNYDDQLIRRQFQNENQINLIYDQAILYTVPDGWSFQHFLDGIGPKLAHSKYLLNEYPLAKIIILKGIRFDRSVKEIWSMLGVEETKRIIHYSPEMKLGAHLLINPCRTPGIHPRLWQDARSIYWSISGINNENHLWKRKNFIYIQRTPTNAMNGARLILNESPFIDLIKKYCDIHQLNYIQYDHSKDVDHIRSRIQLFYNAKIILGVHSGALSNMNFAQSNTIIIEIMPFRSESSSLPMTCSMFKPEDIQACAGYILYVQAKLLNHSYWILPSIVDQQGNIQLNLDRFQNLLKQI